MLAAWLNATMERNLKNHLIGPKGRIIAAMLALATFTVATPIVADTATGDLAPVPRHEKIGQLVTEFIQKSHYRHAAVDDDLSSRVLDRYIEALDNNRMYFLASDIAALFLMPLDLTCVRRNSQKSAYASISCLSSLTTNSIMMASSRKPRPGM